MRTIAGIDPAPLRAVIAAAEQGPLGANPRVGAALVSETGTVLATGVHQGAGTAHAEADALARARSAGEDVAGSTCVVTLEPCAHEGRTPSCASALIDAGVKRVVYAVDDPNAVATGGAGMMRSAGVEVSTWIDVLPEDVGLDITRAASDLNRRWFAAKADGRPFVTAKIAHTLDSKVAAADATSQWITGPDARLEGHDMRARVDAIVVGSGTVAADDPALTARDASGVACESQPLRVVVGERPVPYSARIRGADGRFVHMATRDMHVVLRTLAQAHGAEHVLLEGGPTLISEALRANLVDDLWIHQAPTLLGEGTGAVHNLGVSSLANRIDFEVVPTSLHLAGRDLVFHAIPQR